MSCHETIRSDHWTRLRSRWSVLHELAPETQASSSGTTWLWWKVGWQFIGTAALQNERTIIFCDTHLLLSISYHSGWTGVTYDLGTQDKCVFCLESTSGCVSGSHEADICSLVCDMWLVSKYARRACASRLEKNSQPWTTFRQIGADQYVLFPVFMLIVHHCDSATTLTMPMAHFPYPTDRAIIRKMPLYLLFSALSKQINVFVVENSPMDTSKTTDRHRNKCSRVEIQGWDYDGSRHAR